MEHLIRRIEQVMMFIAVVCMVAIMLTVSGDALGRYLFRAPIPWAFEVVSYYLMIIITYFALSSTFQHGDHIGVDLVYNRFGRRGKAWARILGAALSIVLFALIAWGAWETMTSLFRRNAFLPGYIPWPAWLSHLPIPLGAAALVLRLAHHLVTLIRLGDDPYIENEEIMQ